MAVDTSKRHYQILSPADAADHPADRIVAAMKDVAVLDRKVRAMASLIGGMEPIRRLGEKWTEYEDLRFEQRTLHEERFFDVGYEMGRLASLVDEPARPGSLPSPFRRRLRDLLLTSNTRPVEVVVVLLDFARLLIASDPAPGTSTPPTTSGTSVRPSVGIGSKPKAG